VTLTARQLNRATLARQLLLRREQLEVVDAVHRVVALQAQEAAGPYIGLWNRVKRFDPADLDRAFAKRTVVKGSQMRITLHAVDAADYPAFHRAMSQNLRASRLHDSRFKVAGLSIAEADALLPDVLRYLKQPRTNADVEAWLDERLGVLPRPGIWWAMRTFAPLHHAVTGGPWSFGPRPSYTAARTKAFDGDSEAATAYLLRRYLEGFGPAKAQDFALFAMLRMPAVKPALRSLVNEGQVVSLDGPDGETLYDVPDGPIPPDDSPAPPRLLPMWDNVFLAYVDRSRIVPPDYRRVITKQNGDTLPTLLVDGCVAGVWRAAAAGIEITAFHKLAKAEWTAIRNEAASLWQLLAQRDPKTYSRYGHWWKTLPGTEVRVLGA
jgi:hypothetical protein